MPAGPVRREQRPERRARRWRMDRRPGQPDRGDDRRTSRERRSRVGCHASGHRGRRRRRPSRAAPRPSARTSGWRASRRRPTPAAWTTPRRAGIVPTISSRTAAIATGSAASALRNDDACASPDQPGDRLAGIVIRVGSSGEDDVPRPAVDEPLGRAQTEGAGAAGDPVRRVGPNKVTRLVAGLGGGREHELADVASLGHPPKRLGCRGEVPASHR